MAELSGNGNQGSLASAAVTLVAAPVTGFRMVRSLYINNISGQNVTLHLQKNVSATPYVFHSELMQPGDMLELGDGDLIILGAGETLEGYIDETVATYPVFLVSYGDK